MKLKRHPPSHRREKFRAKKFHVKLVPARAEGDQLQLDLDTLVQSAQFRHMLPVVQRHIHCEVDEEKTSRGGNRHVYLNVDPLSIPERIALQSILGSDPMREWLSLLKYWGKVVDPIQLYEVK